MWEQSGDRIARGVAVASLQRDRRRQFVPDRRRRAGMPLVGGEVLGTVQETESIQHRILVPPRVQGELLELAPEGEHTVEDVIGRVRLADGRIEKLHKNQHKPKHTPHPNKQHNQANTPQNTKQRKLDTFYPLLKGGKAAI